MEERITEEKLRIAYNLLQLGTVSKEDIAKATKLPIEAINELEEEMKTFRHNTSTKAHFPSWEVCFYSSNNSL